MKQFRKSVQITAAAIVVLLATRSAQSGGVLAVAGPSGFNPSVVGKPITWANASLAYYTDQGDLSPLLPQSGANDFVSDAFSRWTAVPSAALQVARAGALAENVDGSNVFLTGNTLTMPADIQPSATNRPLGVVYDQDGQVTDALLGAGAGSAVFCATNSVFGGADSYTLDANFAHALIVINGNCAQQSGDLPTLKYRLIRAAGRILGVGWSQLNDNVRTGTPAPTSEDLNGFPLMHPRGPLCNGPITECVPNPDQLRMDDRAAIAYLYPAPTASTARIHGSIFFSDERGAAGQPMQGVNVVARRVDSLTGTPSHVFATTSISGFRFRGHNGNPITGFQTAQGEPFAKYGSADPAWQGFFDLSGLEIPSGSQSATYQITLEPLNPLYKSDTGLGAARYGAVAPSGSVAPIAIVNLVAGADVTRDIVIANSARVRRDAAEPNGFGAPSPVPAGGSWWGNLGVYGDSDFFYFHSRPGRTFHLRVTALDENHVSTAVKAQPTLGLWERAAALNSPPMLSANAFNTSVTGQTKISATTGTETDLMIGISDFRGDGRPDYQYHARLLYVDSLAPSRIPAGGGRPVILQGYGFNANTSVKIGGQPAAILARSTGRLLVQSPPLGNGSAAVTVTDLSNGDVATVNDGAQYGVTNDDQLHLISSGNPAVPVGADAPNPVRVRVTTSDGVTPVANVNVTFSVTPAQSFFKACNANPCTIATDASGEVLAYVSVRATGEHFITATIANGAQVPGTIVGSAPASSITAMPPAHRVPVGATVSLPTSVRVLSSGSPVLGQQVNFSFGTSPASGSATLAAPSVVTNSAGDAANTVNLANVGSSFTILACVSTGSPCTAIQILAVAPSAIQLQPLFGSSQILAFGQSPAPMVLRVQNSSPDQPVRSVTVSVSTSVFARTRSEDCNLQNSDCHSASARPIFTSFITLSSDENGLITFTPALQASWGAVNVYTLFSVGGGAGQTQQGEVQVFK
ncbi:MAG TPA: IPT/TIG domain-containing protein [Terriglobales bacterium]|nr:IPT/TIG domain-containing protein [Terriglobales bacterium]